MFNNNIGNLLGFHETILWQEYNLSSNPVWNLSFDNSFLECDVAKGRIFKGRRSGIIHNFTMDVDPRNKYIEKFRGSNQWYMMENKDLISSNSFKLKYEKIQLVSFNGLSISFGFSIKEI